METLTIRDITLRGASVPLKRPVATRIGVFENAPMLLIDLHTEEGVTGRTYLFGYSKRGCSYMAAVLSDIVARTVGEPIAPATQFDALTKAFTVMGHQGIATMAIAGFDMACWDALAHAAGAPLATLLGGRPKSVLAYNSCGLGIMAPEAAAEQAVELVAEGNFSAVKLRLGRERLEDDVTTAQLVRKAVGDDIIVPCDFNQGLDVVEAMRRGHALDQEGLYWIEEPIAYDDLLGCARLAAELKTPIQIGENFYGPKAMAEAIRLEAGDYMMPDIERIGGVTGWLRAAALADAAGIPMSSHLFPEVSSHLMAVTPTAHWLEYVDWAAPLLANPVRIENGHAVIPDTPGSGIDWNPDGVAAHAFAL